MRQQAIVGHHLRGSARGHTCVRIRTRSFYFGVDAGRVTPVSGMNLSVSSLNAHFLHTVG
jgi:hypothetical protein